MMGYDHDGGTSWMWGFGSLMVLGLLILIVLAVWAVLAVAKREDHAAALAGCPTPDAGSRSRTRQVLDERYACGELNTDEYTERLHTLGL
jgi:putative membrane protein